MRETLVRSLGWEDPLEKGKATHSSILAWRIPWDMKSQTQLSYFHFHLKDVKTEAQRGQVTFQDHTGSVSSRDTV